jgi:murein DD-endopeptidase MepM/ murein hydrolase activator NlpD
MTEIKYQYNQVTCRYEPIVVTPKQLSHRFLRFLIVSFFLGLGGFIYALIQLPPLDETAQAQKNQRLKAEWQGIYNQIERESERLLALEKNDDENFRMILDLEPLSPSQREAGVGGREKESATIIYPFIKKSYERTEKIINRLDIQEQSMMQLKKVLQNKEKMWAARPAIQPINNENLTRLNTIFGMRLHPIFNYVRPHNGLDLTAPHGTPVYASADGYVTLAKPNAGYGNVIFVHHGFGFETRYAHLSRYNVSEGQTVKRGDLIGFVGNTGTSTNDHLHYEVVFNGHYVNPIHFLNTTLAQDEYNKIIKPAKIKKD